MSFDKLELVLAVMTERQEFCWRLKLKGMKPKEIAGMLGISYQAVYKHLAEGREKAQKELSFLSVDNVFL